MEKDKILKQIRNNKLQNMDYNFLISQLCVLNNKKFEEVKKIVDELIDLNEVSVKNKSFKQTGKKPAYLKKKRKSKRDYRTEIVSDDVYLAEQMLKRKNRNTKKYRTDGKIQATTKGFAFLIPTDPTQTDVYIAEKNLKGALNNDYVAVDVEFSKSGKPEGKVVQILERANDYIIGRIEISKSGAVVTPDDVKIGSNIFVPLNKILTANNGDKVAVKIERYYGSSRKLPDGIVTEVLGKPNEIETEVKALLRSYKLYETFPNKVKDAALKVPTMIDKSQYRNRLDLTDEITFTIDGEDSRDFDDAVSLTIDKNNHWHLGVHIADVGEYVKRDSVLDKEAFKRGTSVYFPGLVLPMLPQELSNGICSLNERVDRLTLSVFIEYDEKFNKIGYDIKESVINSKKRFTYNEVQSIFDGDKSVIKRNEIFAPILNNMLILSKKLMDNRRRAGYIEFDIPEVEISLDPLGDVLRVEKRVQDDSHKLIEAFMVAANEVIAEHFCKLKIPFVYRVHEAPDSEKINNFTEYLKTLGIDSKLEADNIKPLQIQKLLNKVKENENAFVINKVCLRSMKKAKYSPDCMGHFGLALKYYCHFTSPIRRYPDLTIHRIIKDTLNHNSINKTELKQFVLNSSVNSSEREVLAEKVERDMDDLYRVMYMRHYVGEEFDGIISGVTNFGIFVQLDNTVEGLVRMEDLPVDTYNYIENHYSLYGKHHIYKLGDKVRVKTLRADILSREVDFMII